ncbi:GMC oxidoreductase [Flavobacterium sp. ASW18X]|uniref:GMC oxidoreductase n=1 Tax=Flavobacterium sp. ASW18X TaxID=2572595 RepID=UPI0010AE0722|nr:GMC oxidoreductase [Flavobacterium sp. ASW18X]TKD58963.1 GMC family oxidoreductase [Flavobacterium sp. ASW18X]
MTNYGASSNFNHGFPTPGPQSPTGQDVMNHVYFVSNQEWKQIREEEQFDYIVIGSGFCGLAFVERVLKNNPFAKILLLERGGFFLPEHFQDLPGPYKKTLGGLSETFPWSLSLESTKGEYVSWQHGMVPFFGGRSTLWSGWCPRPTKDELVNWPEKVVEVLEAYYKEAEALMNVVPADQITSTSDEKPIFRHLQLGIQQLLQNNLDAVPELTRAIPAPLAVKTAKENDVDFSKFSTPSRLLQLIEKQELLHAKGQGAKLKVATNCIVSRIIEQGNTATALDTSRGVLALNKAKLILAMGTLPPTTLLHNSFPALKNIGTRFTAHFISAIVARVPKKDYSFYKDLCRLEIGAFYVAGVEPKLDHEGQFHVQFTALADADPEINAEVALRNMPDVVATASEEQLMSSKDHVVFVCAVLGELDYKNSKNSFLKNRGTDPTTNVTLNLNLNKNDNKVWDAMDKATFNMLEDICSPKGANQVEYWDAEQNKWKKTRPKKKKYRVSGLVHEASTLWMGTDSESVVGLDYRPKGVENVYVTGASLWPTGASWNPTLAMVALTQHLADNLSKD